jgi:hypothetical protein
MSRTRWTPRHDTGTIRLQNILRAHPVATARTLEQKISDAGPNNQRIDPHILTQARARLQQRTIIRHQTRSNIAWYYLYDVPVDRLNERLDELGPLHDRVHRNSLTTRLGQCLEIAIYRALRSQNVFQFFGEYPDLDAHDDGTLYTKEEPPKTLSGRSAGGKIPDFLLIHPTAGLAAIEAKNIREWFYPDRTEIREFLLKCCLFDVVPVLIARRIHYSTFSVLNPCGVILHEMFNQLYPSSEQALAAQAADKRLLGYHDIRVGNQPDTRLTRFLHENLPAVLPGAKQSFDRFKDLIAAYARGELRYPAFVASVKRRLRGQPEGFEPEEADEPEGDEELDDDPENY